MTVQEIMTRFPTTLGLDDTVHKAAQIMRDEDIGSIPIVDENGSLVGMITDRDIVVGCIAQGHDGDAPVSECMTPHPDTIAKDTTVEQATLQMSQLQVRRLPVIENGRLVGIVSLGDIATSAAPATEKAETLADVSEDDQALRTDNP
jgi:CBS domain-containing protein